MDQGKLNAINNAIKYAKVKSDWFLQEANPRYFKEMIEWLDVASIYINEIKDGILELEHNDSKIEY